MGDADARQLFHRKPDHWTDPAALADAGRESPCGRRCDSAASRRWPGANAPHVGTATDNGTGASTGTGNIALGSLAVKP